MDAIHYFRGEYHFLSNFFRENVLFEGTVYPSSENAFQAAKSLDLKVRSMFADPNISSPEAKRLGRIVVVRPDWDVIKDGVMLDIIRTKFKNSKLRSLLSATSTKYLFEGNNWHDVYWGLCDGAHSKEPKHTEPIGKNKLGKILEQVRFENWADLN
jgi:ribA/ribD-fused uncharacterized protein